MLGDSNVQHDLQIADLRISSMFSVLHCSAMRRLSKSTEQLVKPLLGLPSPFQLEVSASQQRQMIAQSLAPPTKGGHPAGVPGF